MAHSSSSSDEDLSMFQSVAVTADDIAESARKEAAAVVRRKSTSTARAPGQPGGESASTEARANATADGQHTGAEELDLTSLKIAAALDSLLARQLEDATTPDVAEPPATSEPAAPAAASTAGTAADPQVADDTDIDTTGVRLFRRVTPGTACVITSSEYGDTGLAQVHPSKPHLHPGSQQHVRLRDLIPRYSLAASSSKNKRQHDQILAALAVDGDSLLQVAAAAPGTAWQQQQQQQQKAGKKKSAVAAAGTLAAWQGMKKRKDEGLVMDAKEFVPQDVRMAKLLRPPLSS